MHTNTRKYTQTIDLIYPRLHPKSKVHRQPIALIKHEIGRERERRAGRELARERAQSGKV